VGFSDSSKFPVFVTVTTCLVRTDPTRLSPKLKLEVLSVAAVSPGVIAKFAVVDRISFPDVALRVMATDGITAAFEAVSWNWPDCPGMMLSSDGVAVTPEGRSLTVTRMALLNLPTAVAATVTA
jgi:hypothetical protein